MKFEIKMKSGKSQKSSNFKFHENKRFLGTLELLKTSEKGAKNCPNMSRLSLLSRVSYRLDFLYF